ncbi:MAG TPA: hypothetical protein VGM25_06225 [Caulobacteraceae bacterium]
MTTARRNPLALGAILIAAAGFAAPAFAEEAEVIQAAPPAQAAPAPGPQQAPEQPTPTPQPAPAAAPQPAPADAGGMDLFSRNTIHALVDVRLAVADGRTSFVNGGFGKTRFQGTSSGDYRADGGFYEADLMWQPRFGNALSANISGAWQRDKDGRFDLMEAFLNYLPSSTLGPVRLSARAGLMWPEISLEHSTGGAWSTVNTITPSAINSWVGEEVKVIGGEATARASLGENDFSVTGGVFGWNDTSGTLLSFRGWALQDIKATATGYFRLPPLNSFITLLQQNKTQNTVEIDHNPGFYLRADWHPPQPVGVALFYYDNEGDPKAFTKAGQWGWRTRFWNLGINADVAPGTKILAQGMIGSTIMGFPENGQAWVHTDYNSAFVLAVHDFGKFALTGRIEAFQTREHGSEMPTNNSEDGWAWTLAARVPINPYLTGFAEALNVDSRRGTRVTLGGLPSPLDNQMVFQLAVRARL